jgi:hypothetical protein
VLRHSHCYITRIRWNVERAEADERKRPCLTPGRFDRLVKDDILSRRAKHNFALVCAEVRTWRRRQIPLRTPLP